MNKIFNHIDTYYKIATLLGDVANRAMYSLIPGGKFDLTAARWVASGAVDVIYYGTRAVLKELQYYRGDIENISEARRNVLLDVDKEGINKYIDALQKSEVLYRQKDQWGINYGGEPWADICKALLNVALTYKRLLETQKGGEEEERLLRQMIINLNIFDGICHNTGSIYKKMVHEEGIESNKNRKEVAIDAERIENIRNLSELEDPKHLYNEIKDLVYPMRVYKDYETNIRNAPDFYKAEDITEQVERIRDRKYLLIDIRKYLREIERAEKILSANLRYIDEFENFMDLALQMPNEKVPRDIVRHFMDKIGSNLSMITIINRQIYSMISSSYLITQNSVLYPKFKELFEAHDDIKDIFEELLFIGEELFNKKEIYAEQQKQIIESCSKMKTYYEKMQKDFETIKRSLILLLREV